MFNFFYEHSLKLGRSFEFGAFEGLVIYASVIMCGITSVISKKSDKK